MNTDLLAYYRDRAKTYEKIYDKPERKGDLQRSAQLLQRTFAGMGICEIACGTGYWTQQIARTAKSVAASDANPAVLEIARSKNYVPAKVEFRTADLFDDGDPRTYEGLFGGFIWSHIPLQDLPRFAAALNRKLKPGGLAVLLDNRYVEGSSTPLAETDAAGNTWQIRTLEDGTAHKILKNFPSEAFIRQCLSGVAAEIELTLLEYFWIAQYKKI